MKTLLALTVTTVPLLTTGIASAQNSNMMNGDFSGFGWMVGHGGIWMPLLLLVVVVGLIVVLAQRKDK